MKKINKKIIGLVLLNFIILGINILPLLAFAADSQGYQLLAPSVIIDKTASTGETQAANYGLMQYLQTAYIMGFVLVISAAVFWLILGGLEYILSDAYNAKIGAKKKFWNAIAGLVIALSSYLILNLINPDLLKFSLVTTMLNK